MSVSDESGLTSKAKIITSFALADYLLVMMATNGTWYQSASQ